MKSWIVGLIGVALVYIAWRIIRAGLERERRQALLYRRRDRTGRATLGTLSTFGNGSAEKKKAGARSDAPFAPFEREPGTRASIDHASTLPVSFNNSGGWSSNDSCSPTSSDTSSDSGSSSSSD